jgi:glutamate--cysteine ligase catalytic subunit
LELQLTDFENSAYAQLVVLLSRMLLTSGYNLYMPMSYVHENMRRAQLKDAVLTQKFWFRRDALRNPSNSICDGRPNCAYSIPAVEEMDLVEMSVNEIMNGVAAGNGTEGRHFFSGLLPAVSAYVREHLAAEPAASHRSTEHPLQSYLELISRRASGALPTTARWMRNFVTRHPQYVPGSGRLHSLLANDLLQACDDIGMGRLQCTELYGNHTSRLVANIDQLSEQELMCPKFEPCV